MGPKCLICIFLGWNLKKTVVIFEISILKFFWLQISRKTKMPKFRTKNAWLEYFWAGIWKQYSHIWNQLPRICLIPKFHEKTKMPKLGTKNALFGYFGARTLGNYCHISNHHLRIFLIAKFCEVTKILKFGTKNALFEYFWLKMPYLAFLGKNFKKTIVIFEISTLKFVYL